MRARRMATPSQASAVSAVPALSAGALLARLAIGVGLLAVAYGAYGWLRQGDWYGLSIGMLWDWCGMARPFFASRELQIIIDGVLNLSLAQACFALAGFWVFWRFAVRPLGRAGR